MKQQIRLNEAELRTLISECVQEVLNEEVDERNIFTNVRDSLGAMKDTFLKGGGYETHKAHRNFQTSQNDVEKLKKKYGVANGMNDKQIENSMSAETVEQLEAEKKQAIANVAAKYDKKIAAAKQKAAQRAGEYRTKKGQLDAEKKGSYDTMRKGMNTNPYAGYVGNQE